MDRVVGVTLITQTFQKDSIGQEVPTETQKNVIGYKTSISGSEINEAGQRGIMPDCRVEVWTSEYNGAEIVELENKRYTVYRTYENRQGKTELYLELRTGNE